MSLPFNRDGNNGHTRSTPKQILEMLGFQFALNYKLGSGRYSKVIVGSYKSSQSGIVKKVFCDGKFVKHIFY